MSLAALIRGMAAAGAPPEAIALAVEAIEQRDAVDEARRAQARDKKRRQRGTVPGQSRDMTGTVPSETPSPSSSPDPSNNPTPVHTHENLASVSRSWVCPEGVEPRHWSDFLANRKRKRLTNSETAREGVLNDLANLADNEWPPGRLVQLAAAKGWGSINYPTDGPRNAQRNPTHGRSQSGDGLGPTARAALRVIGGG